MLRILKPTGALVLAQFVTSAFYVLVGIMIISSLYGISRSAVRYHRHQDYRDSYADREAAYPPQRGYTDEYGQDQRPGVSETLPDAYDGYAGRSRPPGPPAGPPAIPLTAPGRPGERPPGRPCSRRPASSSPLRP
jgi:hypothetical protein